jgi:hypothetical protein
MRRSRADQPLLITSAPESPDAEFEHRRKRYAIMMAARAVAVVAAALTYHFSIWLAIFFLVGGAILPWSAVILANDGPPKKRARTGFVPPGTEKALPPGGQGQQDRIVDG